MLRRRYPLPCKTPLQENLSHESRARATRLSLSFSLISFVRTRCFLSRLAFDLLKSLAAAMTVRVQACNAYDEYEDRARFMYTTAGSSFRFHNCSENPAGCRSAAIPSRPWSEFDSRYRGYQWRDELRTDWSDLRARTHKKAPRISGTTITAAAVRSH